jgi:catechol 2,3-dioxygenase-like lactoylglutathione lyase family enzyme
MNPRQNSRHHSRRLSCPHGILDERRWLGASSFARFAHGVLTLTGQRPLSVQEFVGKNAATFTAPARQASGGKNMAYPKNESRNSEGRDASFDMKLEIVVIPVSDVHRAKEFYGRLGCRLNANFAAGDDFRVIQFTPPGSGCSVIFGKNVTTAPPGSAQGLYLVASDIEAARGELLGRGVEITEVFHDAAGVSAGMNQPYLFGRRRVSGRDPEHRSYRSFASFSDPDGNGWLLQEITTRLPGRIDPAATSFGSARDLASALRRAEAAHGDHEKRTGKRDENWPDWYAEYMAAEQAGTKLPQ